MRKIGVVTTARSDYGIYRSFLRHIQADPDLELNLLVSGMHLSPEFGRTISDIEADGFPIAGQVEMLLSSDSAEGIAKSMGLGISGFAQLYPTLNLDMLVVLGDRFEMHAAALAALPFNIPVAHIHGGEISEGAFDDNLRHSMTKLSHLHFVACEPYARRVCQLGEEPWRVVVAGAPGLDNLEGIRLLNREEFEADFNVGLADEFLLVTYHPVTLESGQASMQIGELFAALDACGLPCLFTEANADPGGRLINREIHSYVSSHPGSSCVTSLGTQGYFSAMSMARAMVGNSSSGIIESPSFALPVVNIGNRQEGRVRAGNVIDVGNSREEIQTGIDKAVSEIFRKSLDQLASPYGDGHAAERIIKMLKEVPLDENLVKKRFHDQ